MDKYDVFIEPLNTYDVILDDPSEADVFISALTHCMRIDIWHKLALKHRVSKFIIKCFTQSSSKMALSTCELDIVVS